MPQFYSSTIQAHIAAIDDRSPKFLILQRSSSVKLYPNIWQVVTGTIEGDEYALKAAIREVWEETGIVTNDIWTVPYITQFFDPYKNVIHASPVFGFLVDINTKIILSEEHQACKWVTLDEVKSTLELPSHIEGTIVFNNYILKSNNKNLYKIPKSFLRNNN